MFDNLQMALEGKYTTTLGGACVTVDYRVCQNNEGQAHFIYLGTDYNFSMTRWKQKAFSPFRAKFHEVYNDINKYGTSDVDPDTGDVISSSCTSDQNKQIVIRAIEDVFHYLNQLLEQHPRSILDYAVWYREKNDKVETYARYIQLVTCHCIVHSDFLAGNIRWEVVEFVPNSAF